ncbi:MAG: DsbA family protein, partial [Gammaproteobacteria bacterium]|nr:DsbA family protein [Gammaproteobacteria bacterium]
MDFYFDFSSSYSYVALPAVDRLARERGVQVNWKPILLGVIFKALQHAPPTGDNPKMRYLQRDLQRCAELAGLPPFVSPTPFPFNGIVASRAFWHLAASDPDKADDWARAVFHASFADAR